MFSLYGIKNIGNSLKLWQKEFESVYTLISEDKRSKFPNRFVQFLGYTIYNAKKYTRKSATGNEYNLAQAHFQYAKRIPEVISEFISSSHRENISDSLISDPIGGGAIIHSHNTFPAMAQALKCPMWKVPEAWNSLSNYNPEYISHLKEAGFDYNPGFNNKLRGTRDSYFDFAKSLLKRVNSL